MMRTINNVFPDVPVVDFTPRHLGAWKWDFPVDRIGETVIIDGQPIKKMLTLDINIPESDFAGLVNDAPIDKTLSVFKENYPCPHACPGCFNQATVKNSIMALDEIINVVDQAIKLGLESVKFLGPGELIANPRLFEILDMFRERNLVIGIFTKGAILGSDVLAKKYHGCDASELSQRMTSYDNVTFLVGGCSFDPAIENRYIPTRDPELRGKFDYHASRNRALEMLYKAGMNSNPEKQRLAIVSSPVTINTIGGSLELFKWATERNIPNYVTTSMVSGMGHGLVKKQQVDFEAKYLELAVDIYKYLLNKGIMDIERLRREGISSYTGTNPCNQLTHGLYVHYDGEVWRCPGNDTKNYIVNKNVRESSLLEIWKNSLNYQINQFNNGCVKDGVSIPSGFYNEVLKGIEKQYV